MTQTWFTYVMNGSELEEFDTLRQAVASAQSAMRTERRPKRLESGIYFIAGGPGSYSRYIGTPKMFETCGYVWAVARSAVASAASMSVKA